MSKRVVIAGAGGFGRGVYSWITQSHRFLDNHNIDEVVFIDDTEKQEGLPAPIVARIATFEPSSDDLVVPAIGIPNIRRHVVDRLTEQGAQFQSFIDDRAVLANDVTIGVGVVICPGVVISANTVIGDHVHINYNCSIGHDTCIGDFSTLSPAVTVMGNVRSGKNTFFGGGASVVPRISLGEDVVVGAGAVVLKSVDKDLTVAGNPATKVGESGRTFQEVQPPQ